MAEFTKKSVKKSVAESIDSFSGLIPFWAKFDKNSLASFDWIIASKLSLIQ